MASLQTVYLPNGQTLTVKNVFGGVFFKCNELNIHNSIFPAGWTVVLNTDDDHASPTNGTTVAGETTGRHDSDEHEHTHRFRKPTLHNDNVYISSISSPSNIDFKPAASPTRAVAQMLWATLYWYFHLPEPSPFVDTEASKNTPETGKPRGDWRIKIKREGIFRGKSLLHKLERMGGLIQSEESYVGAATDDAGGLGWTNMFVDRRAFWMMSGKLFLFTLSPATGGVLASPYNSRPSSPVRRQEGAGHTDEAKEIERVARPITWMPGTPGPFSSGSHLPTYFPPPPAIYTNTNGVRHPIRPKPPRQGETFYLRYIPSLGQYLSFRVASMHKEPVAYNGPSGTDSRLAALLAQAHMTPAVPDHSHSSNPSTDSDPTTLSDLALLHKWMNNPRVAKFWGCAGEIANQERFLRTNLESRHSFPVIGCWDGKPFGYFEIYWVKEDILGRLLSSGEVSDSDRGVHVLVGEEEFRGIHRLKVWMSALAHYAFLADYRTESVVLEPRVDNERFIQHLQDCKFYKEKEVTFPHKQSSLMRIRRENFHGPAL